MITLTEPKIKYWMDRGWWPTWGSTEDIYLGCGELLHVVGEVIEQQLIRDHLVDRDAVTGVDVVRCGHRLKVVEASEGVVRVAWLGEPVQTLGELREGWVCDDLQGSEDPALRVAQGHSHICTEVHKQEEDLQLQDLHLLDERDSHSEENGAREHSSAVRGLRLGELHRAVAWVYLGGWSHLTHQPSAARH
jgi:hypothetical protein